MRWVVEQEEPPQGEYVATVEHEGRTWTAKHWNPMRALLRARAEWVADVLSQDGVNS